MANVIHINTGLAYWRAEVDFEDDTIKAALMIRAHTPSASTQFWSQISADEVSGTGYDAGGQTIANPTVTLSGTATVFDGDDSVWSNSTIAAGWVAIYKDTGTPATSRLITTKDFGAEKNSSNAPFTVEYSTNGILRMNQ